MTDFGNISFLYTNIGRGHPHYLDGIIEAMVRAGEIKLVRRQTDVFEISHGASLAAWKSIRWLYRQAASNGVLGWVYHHIRGQADYNRSGVMLSILGRDIRRAFPADSRTLVVAHPSLVGILRGRRGLIYQHGELVVPAEAVVTGAEYILVPTLAAAKPFHRAGYSPMKVVVTGLCIEPPLVKQAELALARRAAHVNGQEPLTGAFFSSGAEPRSHVEKLVMAAAQTIVNGGNAILFARDNGAFLRRIRQVFEDNQIDYYLVDATEYLPTDLPSALVIVSRTRREENIFTARLFPSFDYLVAPSHERSNWALGLGLPMFIVGPAIGPYAPLNRQLLLDSGVACDLDTIESAAEFDMKLTELRQYGKLSEMSQAGWGKHPITGFDGIARFLAGLHS